MNEINEISEFVDILPLALRNSLFEFVKESKYRLTDIQQYFKEQFDINFPVVLISDWLKESIPISEKVRYLQAITDHAEGIQTKESLQYLFMRGLHLSIVLLDKLEIELPEEPEKVGKLAKEMLQETTRLGKLLEEFKAEKTQEVILGTATEIIQLMEESFRDTNYEEVYKQTAYNALRLIESRAK